MFCSCCLGQLPSFGQSLYLLQGGRVNKPNPPRLHVAAIKFHPSPRISESGHIVDESTPSEKVGCREGKKQSRDASILQNMLTFLEPSSLQWCLVLCSIDFHVISQFWAEWLQATTAIKQCICQSHLSVLPTHVLAITYTQTHIILVCSASKYRKRDWNF